MSIESGAAPAASAARSAVSVPITASAVANAAAAGPNAAGGPIVVAAVQARLDQPVRWTVRTVAVTGSTNADLLADRAAPDGAVLIAELQTSGSGRRGRHWQAPAGAGLTMSVLIDAAQVPPSGRGWISLLAGVAVAEALTRVLAEVDRGRWLPRAANPASASAQSAGGSRHPDVGLKWPNDILLDGLKCGGLLAQVAPGNRVVLGIGVNVALTAADLPRPDTTSLLVAGATVDRAALAAAILNRLGDWIDRFAVAAGDPARSGLLAAYTARCRTLGRDVEVQLPTGESVCGEAVGVDSNGALIVQVGDQRPRFAAADVVHLRPATASGAAAATGRPRRDGAAAPSPGTMDR